MKFIKLLLPLIISSAILLAQTGPQQIILSAPVPNPLTNLTTTVVGGNGFSTYYYYVIVNYPIGAVASGAFQVQNAPATISGGNYIRLNWQAVPGASTYTIVRGTTATLFTSGATSGTCANCLIGTTNSTTLNDTTGSPGSPFTLNGPSGSTIQFFLNNRDYTTPELIGSNVQGPAVPFVWTQLGGNGIQCLTVDNTGKIIAASCSGVGAVSITAGVGISVSPNPITGIGVITNTAPGSPPASPLGAIQFNNSGAFGGSADLLWNGFGDNPVSPLYVGSPQSDFTPGVFTSSLNGAAFAFGYVGTSQNIFGGLEVGVEVTDTAGNTALNGVSATRFGGGNGFPIGVSGIAGNSGPNLLSDAYGILGSIQIWGSGNTTNGAAIVAFDAGLGNGGSGALVNDYGLLVKDITFGTNNWAIHTGLGLVQFGDMVISPLYSTTTNCADSAGAAACGAAPAGSFVIDAGTSSTVVSTTAITANSQIILQEDSSLSTRLSVTCNTQSSLVLGALRITARTANTSFTTTIEANATANPVCINYWIVN